MILSIQKNGVMEPTILRDRGDGKYQLLSGARRRRVSELAEKKDIPAFVYQMTIQEAIATTARRSRRIPKHLSPANSSIPPPRARTARSLPGLEKMPPTKTARPKMVKSPSPPSAAKLEAKTKAGEQVSVGCQSSMTESSYPPI